MSELQLAATAPIAAAALIGLAYLLSCMVQVIHGYMQGRKRGGYPVFAKARRKLFVRDFADAAFIKGMKSARKKIERGGYK